MSAFPEPRVVELPARSGQPKIELAVHEQGSGPAVVFSHGFPELAYSWRHQLSAVAEAGFRAIAPDQRGYGGSTCPERIEDYALSELSADLVGLLDALDIERAVFVGHDWGGAVVWAMPVLHPERTAGVVGVCTPYLSMSGGLENLKQLVDGDVDRYYVLWFQEPGRAESVMDARVEFVFDRLLRKGVPLEQAAVRATRDGKLDMNPFRNIDAVEAVSDPLVTQDELAYYVRAFEKTGFRGGINWYRNIERNGREHPEIGTRKLELPCLMLTAAWDFALPPSMAEGMQDLCSDLEVVAIEEAGHWVQQEQPAAVNAALVGWLRRRFGVA